MCETVTIHPRWNNRKRFPNFFQQVLLQSCRVSLPKAKDPVENQFRLLMIPSSHSWTRLPPGVMLPRGKGRGKMSSLEWSCKSENFGGGRDFRSSSMVPPKSPRKTSGSLRVSNLASKFHPSAAPWLNPTPASPQTPGEEVALWHLPELARANLPFTASRPCSRLPSPFLLLEHLSHSLWHDLSFLWLR